MSEPDSMELLDQLLIDERSALISGNLHLLSDLIAEKERLLSDLETQRGESKLAERIRRKADENQKLLEAALKGVRAARERVDMARRGGPALNTYDARGKPSAHCQASASVERRV